MLCGIYKTINIHTPFLIYPVLVAMSFMSLEALSTVDMLNAQLGYQLRHSVLGYSLPGLKLGPNACTEWRASAHAFAVRSDDLPLFRPSMSPLAAEGERDHSSGAEWPSSD